MSRAARLSIVTVVAVSFGWFFGRADAQKPPPADLGPAPIVTPPARATIGEVHHEESEPPDPAGSVAPRPPTTKTPLMRVQVPQKDGMFRLPGGRFMMGAGYGPRNEGPPHPVTLAPFWIDRTEVSVADYRTCVERGLCERPAKTSATCTYDLDDPDLPVSCVHWQDAEAYCRSVGKRLPSEAEWEFSARGNQSATYPWGGGANCKLAITMVSEMPDRSCAPHPMRVGGRPGGASIFGVQDLSGNVEEWTADWYVERPGGAPAPRVGAAHVLRGGGWLSNPSGSRTTSRNWGSSVEAGPNVGFRCAKND